MHRGVVRAGKQQPVAVRALVLGPVLDQHLADLLVVRVVAHAGGEKRQPLHQRLPVGAALDIGLGPGDAVRPVQAQHRIVHPVKDLPRRQLVGAARGAQLDRLGVADALLVPGGAV